MNGLYEARKKVLVFIHFFRRPSKTIKKPMENQPFAFVNFSTFYKIYYVFRRCSFHGVRCAGTITLRLSYCRRGGHIFVATGV